jgi:hypothetical protein
VGLPDGIFSDQKSQFGKFLEGLAIEHAGILYGHYLGLFYGHLVYYEVIWHIFPILGILYGEKSGNPVRVLRNNISLFMLTGLEAAANLMSEFVSTCLNQLF